MIETEFLFDNQLISELENLIKNAKHKLILISPFIDLDERIKDALLSHKTKHDFELQILFGKNENNLYKSVKKDSIDFLKQFPNIEIRFNELLHAKFYRNDYDILLTSLNLYDYSLSKNIEVGIKFNYASKGLLKKVIDGTENLFAQGVEKVKQDVIGMKKEIDPIEKFETIFQRSELKYKTKPTFETNKALFGILNSKKMNGFQVIVDKFSSSEPKVSPTDYNKATTSFTGNVQPLKTISGTQISKANGITLVEFNSKMQSKGFIQGDKITPLGKSIGLTIKTFKDKNYIAYPENILELD